MMGLAIVAGGKPDMAVPSAGILASDLAVGSVVKLMEDGVATEYLVVNQGIPSNSSLYDASCDGLWLLRKDIHSNRVWDADNSNVLETSDIHTWLNADMFAKFDSITQNVIKQVKIPYLSGGGDGGIEKSGANGLSCKIFLLSGYEVGWTISTNSHFPLDGAALSYFSGAGNADSNRIAYLYGRANNWWTRSPRTGNDFLNYVMAVNSSGGNNGYLAQESTGVRPALVLPFNALFDTNTLILKGVA